jgi:glycerol-3-phosphate O-acyltransferase
VWITQREAKDMISKTKKLGFIEPIMIATKKVYRPTSDQVATLSFYKNNIVHLFILYSLICESLKFIKKASKEEIIKLIEMIYPIFAKDFHLKNEIIDKGIYFKCHQSTSKQRNPCGR